MRQTLQRRPGFEALESMTLLSGLAGAAVSTPAPLPTHLTGSISGIYTTATFYGTSDRTVASAVFPTMKSSGSISPVGHVTGSGPLGYQTLKAKTGEVLLSIRPNSTGNVGPQGREFFKHAGNVMSAEYTIAGGGKAFAGATGSGNVRVTTLGHSKFTETFS